MYLEKGKEYLIIEPDYSYKDKEFIYNVKGIYSSDGTQIENHIEDWNNDGDIYGEMGVYLKLSKHPYDKYENGRNVFIEKDILEKDTIVYEPIENPNSYQDFNGRSFKLLMKFNYSRIYDGKYNNNPLLFLLESSQELFIVDESEFDSIFNKKERSIFLN